MYCVCTRAATVCVFVLTPTAWNACDLHYVARVLSWVVNDAHCVCLLARSNWSTTEFITKFNINILPRCCPLKLIASYARTKVNSSEWVPVKLGLAQWLCFWPRPRCKIAFIYDDQHRSTDRSIVGHYNGGLICVCFVYAKWCHIKFYVWWILFTL